MLLLPFGGSERFISLLDQCLQQGSEQKITEALRQCLSGLIQDADIQLPSCVYESTPEHYSRREIYRSPDLGYSVIAMTWGPGQGTPLHDHSGMWCVEGVWSGNLEVVQFDLLKSQQNLFYFSEVGVLQAGPGSTGSLIPPHEYHIIRNVSQSETAVSVHIYQNQMMQCSVFRDLGNNCYERTERVLCLD
jgi:predicted metal-dependent enzyme (double-stranded beta helix superfamily)